MSHYAIISSVETCLACASAKAQRLISTPLLRSLSGEPRESPMES